MKNRVFVITLLFFASSYFSCSLKRDGMSYHKQNTSFKLSEKEIIRGDSLTLSWSAPLHPFVKITGIGDSLPPEGSLTLQPDTFTSYKLYVPGHDKDGERAFSYAGKKQVLVNRPGITVQGERHTTDEKPVKLEWYALHAKYVKMQGLDSILPVRGALEISPDTTSAYHFKAFNNHGYTAGASHTVEVAVVERKPADTFVVFGQQATFSWIFKSCDSVTIAGRDTVFAAKDSFTIRPMISRPFDIIAHRQYHIKDIFRVQCQVYTPRVVSLKAPSMVKKGRMATISWQVVNAQHISSAILGDSLPSAGSKKIRITKPTTITLTATSKELNDQQKKDVRSVTIYPKKREFIKGARKFEAVKSGEKIDFEIIAVDRSNYPEEIKLHVIACDTLGNFVHGLAPPAISKRKSRKYFIELIESVEGRDRTLRRFDVEEDTTMLTKPYDVSMVLDYSGSMYHAIPAVALASKLFMVTAHDSDRISLVKFDDKISRLNELSTDKQYLTDSAKLNTIEGFGGYTALYAAASEGIDALKDAENKKIMVLFTDGRENASFQYFGKHPYLPNQLIQKARKEQVRIIIVSFGTGPDDFMLQQMADLADGNHYHILGDNVTDAFFEMPHIMRNFYTITYKPTVKEGEHQVALVYNNNQGGESQTQKNLHIGDDFDIEGDQATVVSYWRSAVNGKKPVSPPQAVAFFEFDSDSIPLKYIPALDKYADYMSKNPGTDMVVYGHTDSKGTDKYCYDLSLKRAQAVRAYLASKDIDTERMQTKALGKQEPVWPVEDTEWKARENRRTEIVLYE